MNERIQELAELAWTMVSDEERNNGELYEADRQRERRDQVFAQLLVDDVLAEVAERAYYSGDRAWSDELDRPWIELEFGFGELAK